MRNILYLLAISIFVGVLACNDPLELENDLFLEDEADIQFRDDFSIVATTILEDSVLAYTPSTEYTNYPFGTMIDPIFGQSTSSIYAQLRLIPPQDTMYFPTEGYDSIVLSLAYSTDGSYGNIDETFGIEVHRIIEDIDADSDYYSDQTFDFDPVAVGIKTFTPAPTDSVNTFIYRDGFDLDSLYRRPAHIRITLDDAFGEELYNIAPPDFADSELILQTLKGLHLRPSTVNSGLIGFDLRSPDTRLAFYYTDTLNGQEIPQEFNFYFTELSAKTLNMASDPTGSPLEPFVDDPILGDSLLFTQGMAGTVIEMTIPELDDLSGVIVNKAELEFFVADLDSPSDTAFTTTQQLVMLEDNADGTRVLIEDATIALQTSSLDIFGGTLMDTDAGVQRYNMNISTHVQNIIDGVAPSTMFIQPFPKPSNFSRVVVYGAGHSTYPMRLKLTYTQL